MGLESYQARYTYQLQDWSERVFKKRNIDYVVVPGEEIDNTQSIQVGQVLDTHGRSYYNMSQMMNLVQYMRDEEVLVMILSSLKICFNPVLKVYHTSWTKFLKQTDQKYMFDV